MAKKSFSPNFDWNSVLKNVRALSHSIRRIQVKKFKRKFKRQFAAFERDKEIRRFRKSKEYKKERKEVKRKRKQEENDEKRKTKLERQKWLQIELQSRLKIEQKIKKSREREEALREIRSKQKETEDRVLDELAWKAVTVSKEKSLEIWHNPFLPVDTNFADECPYFKKVGSCRFEFKCKMQHNVPYSSNILLFPNMFHHISFVHPLRDESEFDETDLWIESDEDDLRKLYKEFYADVLDEFQKFGYVVRIFVCRNEAAHLRGNVYVEFREEENAVNAEKLLKGRWYDGRQIWPRFCTINSWKAAICDSFSKGKCSKRNKCNFLHVFDNV